MESVEATYPGSVPGSVGITDTSDGNGVILHAQCRQNECIVLMRPDEAIRLATLLVRLARDTIEKETT